MYQNYPSLKPSSASRDPAVARPSNRGAPRPRGFTLTELLVVIAIISMLVAITSVAVMRGLDTAKQTRIKTEVDQLDTAFKAYKEKYGSYPPWELRPQNADQVRQHIAQAFPRYDLTNLYDDLALTGLNQTGNVLVRKRPDQALVFWLRGFSNDPLHPFVTVNDEIIENGVVPVPARKATRTPFFDFDESRLVNVSSPSGGTPVETPDWKSQNLMPSYFPQGVTPGRNGAPYVYYDAANYGTAAKPERFNYATQSQSQSGRRIFGDAGVVVPYWHDVDGNGQPDPTENWANPDSFQIIASGGDGAFGEPGHPTDPTIASACRLFPTGTFYDTSVNLFDDDNVTNFCSQARLEAAKP